MPISFDEIGNFRLVIGELSLKYIVELRGDNYGVVVIWERRDVDVVAIAVDLGGNNSHHCR